MRARGATHAWAVTRVARAHAPQSPSLPAFGARPMSDAFHLSMPWWEYLVRACIVYFVLLGMIRVSGKRSMGQFTSFDMLLVVLLGNAVQNALLGSDNSVSGGLIL